MAERKKINKDELFSYLKGKHLAVVCNGSCILKKKDGNLIDSFETVVRFNGGYPDKNPESLGKKTNILMVVDKVFDRTRYGNPDLIIGTNTLWGLKEGDVDIFARPLFNKSLNDYSAKHTHASSAMIFICLAIEAGIASLDIFGHDVDNTISYYSDRDMKGIHDYKSEDAWYVEYANQNNIPVTFH